MAENPWQDLIWQVERSKSWSSEVRLVGAYLLSGPASNRIGCFPIVIVEIANHTGVPVDSIPDLLAILEQDGFIRRDLACGWAWFPDVLRRHPFTDSEQVRQVLPQLAAVPREASFRDELIQVFRQSADRPGAQPPAESGREYLRRWKAFLLDLVDTRPLRILSSLFVALAVIFVVFPGIDLGVARWFFVPPRSFTLGETWIGRFFDSEIHFAMEWFLVLLVGLFVYGLIRKREYWGLTPKNFLFVALSIGLSAGLVTNVVFKDSWGRARPSQIVEFGGTKQFSPPFMRSTQCDKNCSFVSGDASLATSFLVFAVIARRNKPLWWGGISAFAGLVGLMRMGRGSHFLSDVVFAMIFTLMIMLVVARVILDDRWRGWPRWRSPSDRA